MNPGMKMKQASLFLTLLMCIVQTTTLMSGSGGDKQYSFPMEDLFPWAIVPYDSVERGPKERLAMLKDMGFTQYAYDWRQHHLDSMAEELALASEMGIKVIAVWTWVDGRFDKPGQLSEQNERMLRILEESGQEISLWIGFHENNFDGKSVKEKLAYGTEIIRYLDKRANAIGCTVNLYNHGGWSGEPENLVKMLQMSGEKDVGLIYSFHHGHSHLNRFNKLVKLMVPYLNAVVVNGMELDGRNILNVGEGDFEAMMIQSFIDAGYKGNWGLLGHVKEENVELVLKRNLRGLRDLYLPFAASGTTISLWGNDVLNSTGEYPYEVFTHRDYGNVSLSGVSRPEMIVFAPQNAEPSPVVIVCPGGGYRNLSFYYEGVSIAERLVKSGYRAAVLKYRLPNPELQLDPSLAPVQDAQRAIQILRERADEFGIRKDKIGIIGFSAGGHLASTATHMWKQPVIPGVEPSAIRPDFSALIYPVISFDDAYAHQGSRRNLLGDRFEDEELRNQFSAEKQFDASTPPVFLTHAMDDKGVVPENSMIILDKLKSSGVSVEAHFYESGGHGFGLNPNRKESWIWMDEFINWLEKQK